MTTQAKILFISMKYDYGDPSRGFSYDYKNLYDVLKITNLQVEFFDYMETLKIYGREKMNQILLDKFNEYNPTHIFISFYTDQLLPATIEYMTTKSITIGIFYDDTWRKDYTVYWARKLTHFTTTNIWGEYVYKEYGIFNSIYYKYGYSPEKYKKLKNSQDKKIDVSFVGSANAPRRWMINYLNSKGIKVEAYGHGWANGCISHEKMIEVFNTSKINLNLSNSVQSDVRYFLSSPRGLINFIKSTKKGEQTKGRHVEINACGGFQLSFYADGLEDLYEINREIAVYTNIDDLYEKIKFYLKNNDLRKEIADAGYLKTINEHSHLNRINNLLEYTRKNSSAVKALDYDKSKFLEK